MKLLKIIFTAIFTAFLCPFILISQMGPINSMSGRNNTMYSFIDKVWRWASPDGLGRVGHLIFFYGALAITFSLWIKAMTCHPNIDSVFGWYILGCISAFWPSFVIIIRLMDGKGSWPWNA